MKSVPKGAGKVKKSSTPAFLQTGPAGQMTKKAVESKGGKSPLPATKGGK